MRISFVYDCSIQGNYENAVLILSFLCFHDALMHILLLSSSVMLQSFISLSLQINKIIYPDIVLKELYLGLEKYQ